MRRVNPVADDKKHASLIAYLESKHKRYALLYRLGVDTGLRVSDLLCLRARHMHECRRAGSYKLTMVKTKAEIIIQPSDEILSDILAYIGAYHLRGNDALFWSRPAHRGQPLTRQHVHRVMKAAGSAVGLSRIGSHTMWRTFALKHYRACQDILRLQQALGHRYISSTMLYLLDADRKLVV